MGCSLRHKGLVRREGGGIGGGGGGVALPTGVARPVCRVKGEIERGAL